MKKQYIAPKIEMVVLEQGTSILTGSTPISDFNSDGLLDGYVITNDDVLGGDVKWD